MVPNIDLGPAIIAFFVCVPLALWKVIDILIWLFTHVHVSIYSA